MRNINTKLCFLSICVFTSSILPGVCGPENLSAESYQERIYLHVNDTFFLTGETLLFSAYCIHATDHSPSGLSTIAYVELIDENGLPALRTKIKLTDGRGAGDFFLPSTLLSGNYTLIAYSRWMKNYSNRFFFRTEITVINPFKKPAEELIQKSTPRIAEPEMSSNEKNVRNVDVVFEKKKFKTREAVTMKLAGPDFGNKAHLSIGIRRIEKPAIRPRPSMANYFFTNAGENSDAGSEVPESLVYLPELRGNLITGTIRTKDNPAPVAGKVVYLTAPAKDYLFYASVTDSAGRFYFNSDQLTSSQYIVLKTEACSGCLITLDGDFLAHHDDFIPSSLKIDPALRTFIEKRSVGSQIENAYFQINHDSIVRKENTRFYRNPDHVYWLDQFVRFPTMEDVLREYVVEVYVRKKDGVVTLKAMNGRTGIAFREDPLLLLDGVPVFDPMVIMNYDPLRVEKIEILTRKYFYGPLEVNGIISFQTYEGDAQGLSFQDAVRQLYVGIQPLKSYYAPNYSVAREELSRIPDYRVQLFWDPDFIVHPNQTASIDFHTSDMTGEFEVTIEGMLEAGGVVHHQELIEVHSE